MLSPVKQMVAVFHVHVIIAVESGMPFLCSALHGCSASSQQRALIPTVVSHIATSCSQHQAMQLFQQFIESQ